MVVIKLWGSCWERGIQPSLGKKPDFEHRPSSRFVHHFLFLSYCGKGQPISG